MAKLTISQAFDRAFQHHQAGRLREAEQLYRDILTQEPQHADALHLLGVVAYQVGQNEVAVGLIRQAIALNSNRPEVYCNLGNALKNKGQLEEAIAAYREAIARNPGFVVALYNLANALRDQGQLSEAIAVFRRVVALSPGLAEAHNNLGLVLMERGELDEAIAALRQTIALNSQLPRVHVNLGIALRNRGQLEEAVTAYRQAITLHPGDAEAHNNLGNVLKDQGQFNQAIAAYEQAISLQPHYAEAHSNLGVVLSEVGRLEEAIVSYGQAIALKPEYPGAHNNLANALNHIGRLDEAIAAYRQAIALQPTFSEAHFNLALLLLLQGDYREGWMEHEWRWQCKEFTSPRRNFSQPQWDGSDLTNRTILLHAEQGFGDALHFIRYIPLVAARGGKVIIECRPELIGLLRRTPGLGECLVVGEVPPAFDVHCPFLSLPLAFGTTLANIPATVPYVHADPASVEHWRKKLAGDLKRLKVGVVWAGNRTHLNDRNRSISLATLAPLAQGQGDISFYSLQKGDGAGEAKDFRGLKLIDHTDDLHDFADTAALIANLDLVISVDTAVVHLAGAMGKPVWTLLPFAPDWRWLLGRSDSPWYPSMRLFRQSRRGDWDSVVRQVVEALAGLGRG